MAVSDLDLLGSDTSNVRDTPSISIWHFEL